jgi:hypothetical protein
MPNASKFRFFPGNGWMFGRTKDRQRREDLRASYGDNCWRCGHPMNFNQLAVRRRATVEHLLARSQGGTGEWKNIRLCHSGCNRHLGTHPPEHKVTMRLALAQKTVPEFVERVRSSCSERNTLT